MPPKQFLNQDKLPGSEGHTVQWFCYTGNFSTRLNSFQRTHSPMKMLPGNLSTRLNSLVLKDTQSKEVATRQFLNMYNSMRTNSSIFKLTLDSMLNQLANISARLVSTRTQTTSNTVIKAESQSTNFLQQLRLQS